MLAGIQTTVSGNRASFLHKTLYTTAKAKD
jgi:hypothetical protein